MYNYKRSKTTRIMSHKQFMGTNKDKMKPISKNINIIIFRLGIINIIYLLIVIIMKKMRKIMPNNLLKIQKLKKYSQFHLNHIITNNLHLKKTTIIFYLILRTHLLTINNLLDNPLDKQSRKRKEPQYNERLTLLMQVELFSSANFQEVIINLLITFKCNRVRLIILIAP